LEDVPRSEIDKEGEYERVFEISESADVIDWGGDGDKQMTRGRIVKWGPDRG
jgi:hypothetical protein